MKLRRGLVALAVLAGGVSGLAPLSAVAADDPVLDLYVAGNGDCTNAGTGTQAMPFCTIQKAADVVTPGQTVHVEGATYHGSVRLTRSGTPDAPITFVGQNRGRADLPEVVLAPPAGGGSAKVTVSGAHDVGFVGFSVQSGSSDAFDIEASHDITLDMDQADRLTGVLGATTPDTSAGFSVDGDSSDIALTRNRAIGGPGYGVQVASGAQQVTIAGNLLVSDLAGGVRASGVTGLDMTGNSVVNQPCSTAVALDGGTTGALENNALWASRSTTSTCDWAPLVSVAADSTGGVSSDYNALVPQAANSAYEWGGTSYATAADLAAAEPGQAAHDIDGAGSPYLSVGSALQAPVEGSPLIDSADPHAPGVTALDFYGKPRSADDPNTVNSGTGAMDRGAFERQSVMALDATYSPAGALGTAPYAFTVDAEPTDSWGEPVSTVADFGDGSAPQPLADGATTHTYATSGQFTVKTTATNVDGQQVSTTKRVDVATTDAPVLNFSAAQSSMTDSYSDTSRLYEPDSASFTYSAAADSWELESASIEYGDGITQSVAVTSTPELPWHVYAHPGTYTATLTTTDVLGRTSTAKATVTVGDEIMPIPAQRAYDTRWSGNHAIAAHGTLKLSAAQLGMGGDEGLHGIYLTTTVTRPGASGYLTVYPDGTTRPAASTLNFGAGKTVPNTVLAQVGADGKIAFYNGSAKSTDLIVDVFGSEFGLDSSGEGGIGDTYSPVGPARVLDTRNGTGASKGAVAGKHDLTFTAAGTGPVPSHADAVVMNIASTDTKATGYLRAYGHGTQEHDTSNSNWAAGQTVSNLVVVPLADAKVVLHNGSTGSADFVADVVGYYHHLGDASVDVTTAQTRVLDTRDGTGTGGKVARIAAGATVRLQVAGHAGVPASGATAAELNLTVQHQTKNGYITAYPDGGTRPTASSLNFRSGVTVANAAVLPVGSDGAIDFYNGSAAPVDLIVDLSGCFYSSTG